MYTDTRHDLLSSFIADVIENWNDVVVKVADFFFVIVIDIFIIIVCYHFSLKREKSSFVSTSLFFLSI